jgi:hypothetical protein
VTAACPARDPDVPVLDACCSPDSTCEAEPGMPVARDARWRRAVRTAGWLAWAGLAWMRAEGAIGLRQCLAAGRSR